MENRYLNEKEVALYTGISLAQLRNSRFYGKGISYYKFSKSVRYLLSDVEAWCEARKINISQN